MPWWFWTWGFLWMAWSHFLCMVGGLEFWYEHHWWFYFIHNSSFGSSDSYENTLIYPETCSSPTNCTVYTIRGFFPSSVIEQFTSSLRYFHGIMRNKLILLTFYYNPWRNWASKSDIPWLSITIHGFMDAPTSWSSVEHGFDTCGDNNHTAVLFPQQDIMWSFLTHHSRETKF